MCIKLADLFLGDVSLSSERHQVIEFSFFTLADSGAFVTHAPRRLNEALAILRPFNMDVWPYLVLTVLFSGPILYAVIILPYKWLPSTIEVTSNLTQSETGFTHKRKPFYLTYIKEITPFNRRQLPTTCTGKSQYSAIVAANGQDIAEGLFYKCIWYTVRLFLKQCM